MLDKAISQVYSFIRYTVTHYTITQTQPIAKTVHRKSQEHGCHNIGSADQVIFLA